MPNSIFSTNSPQPNDEQLKTALGRAAEFWDDFVGYVNELYEGIRCEWKIYGKMTGWQLVFIQKERKILHLTPGKGQFSVWFALSEIGAQAVKESKLPRSIRETVRTITPHYNIWAHSYYISDKDDLVHIKELLNIKYNT